MKIKFTNTVKDLVIFNLRNIVRFPNNLVIAVVLAFWVFTSLDNLAKYGLFYFIIESIIFLLVFLTIIALLSLLIIFISVKIRGDKKDVLCEHEMEFGEGCFVEKTALSENRYQWAALKKTVSTGSYFYLYVSSTMAHIIPLRCLSVEEVEAVRKLMGK